MADLRIVDAPVLLQESITDDVKMPTGKHIYKTATSRVDATGAVV